jgi:DNA gyrase/topoisomerase IV subunit A
MNTKKIKEHLKKEIPMLEKKIKELEEILRNSKRLLNQLECEK